MTERWEIARVESGPNFDLLSESVNVSITRIRSIALLLEIVEIAGFHEGKYTYESYFRSRKLLSAHYDDFSIIFSDISYELFNWFYTEWLWNTKPHSILIPSLNIKYFLNRNIYYYLQICDKRRKWPNPWTLPPAHERRRRTQTFPVAAKINPNRIQGPGTTM